MPGSSKFSTTMVLMSIGADGASMRTIQRGNQVCRFFPVKMPTDWHFAYIVGPVLDPENSDGTEGKEFKPVIGVIEAKILDLGAGLDVLSNRFSSGITGNYILNLKRIWQPRNFRAPPHE